MQLEDYFEFETFATKFGPAERIRLKGSRIAIEVIIDDFNAGATAEQIQKNYPTISLEQVYAAITYYLHSKPEVDAYIQRGRTIEDAYYQEYLKKGPFYLRDEATDLTARPPTSAGGSAHE
jgi:uncharacterized protein (DUF433 family)